MICLSRDEREESIACIVDLPAMLAMRVAYEQEEERRSAADHAHTLMQGRSSAIVALENQAGVCAHKLFCACRSA